MLLLVVHLLLYICTRASDQKRIFVHFFNEIELVNVPRAPEFFCSLVFNNTRLHKNWNEEEGSR